MKRMSLFIALICIMSCNVSVFALSEIKLNANTYHFGDINEAGGTITTSFVIENTGNTPLVITDVVTANYRGIQINYSRSPIPPGQKARITLTFNPIGFVGSFSRSFTMYSNTVAGTHKLYLKGNILSASDYAQRQNNQGLTKPMYTYTSPQTYQPTAIAQASNTQKASSNKSNTAPQSNSQYSSTQYSSNSQSTPIRTTPQTVIEVDVNIPITSAKAENTFVVIIANENYKELAAVPYAKHDGEVFAQYCNQTLGIPKDNVRAYYNATFGEIHRAIADIKQIANAYNGKINLVFYYAGHGAPNETTKEAYLMPIDAFDISPEYCYSLDKLYADLAGCKALKTVVFLDACFSGSGRSNNGAMLASARGVAITPKKTTAQGNMVIISATSDNETAMPYEKQQHGLFTFFLLKKLQETRGAVTLQELSNYIVEQVSRQSIVINRKAQTPTVTPSSSATDWGNWKL